MNCNFLMQCVVNINTAEIQEYSSFSRSSVSSFC
jgi:hypothetical protein